MKKEQHKDIDSVFKHGLTDPANEPAYQAADWDALDDMLNEVKTPASTTYWLRVLSGGAATVLLALGWWLFAPQATNDANKAQVVVQPKATNDGKIQPITGTDESPSTVTAVPKTTGPLAKEPNQVLAENKARNIIRKESKLQQLSAIIAHKADYIAATDEPVEQPKIDLAGPKQSGFVIPEESSNETILAANTIAIPHITDPNAPISSNWAEDDEKRGKLPSLEAGKGRGPQFALSILAAPELNGTNALNGSSRGTNVGLLFSVGISKFTVSTGAMYTVKPYSANGGNYYTSYKYGKPLVPQSIAVDCRMLDIPLNIDYQLYNKRNNKFSIGTGLTSYIMTHESYNYTYAASTHTAPVDYRIENPGRYFFSVMNLQATYQRQLNSKFGVVVQPYFKVPLSNIGYGQVKLQTLGVAVGVNWNINSLSKPK